MMQVVEVGKMQDGTVVYARGNCKQCHGQGYRGIARPVKGSENRFAPHPIVCHCVFSMQPKPQPKPQAEAQAEQKRESFWKRLLKKT